MAPSAPELMPIQSGMSVVNINGSLAEVLNGRYMIRGKLGVGSDSTVLKGYDLQEQRKVAIKVVQKSRRKNSSFSKRLKRELLFMRVLNSQYFPALHDVIEHDKELYLIMGYVRGTELYTKIQRQRRIGEKEMREIFRQLACAVAELHAFGIAHRDIKPENVLVDKKRQAHLIDFGLSNICGPNHMTTFCGTPNYMAPEVLHGKSYDGKSVDVWSLGVTLYTAVVGGFPFDGDSVEEIFDKVVEGRLYMPSFISPQLSDLILRMLNRDSASRPSITDILKHPWVTEGLSEPLPDFSDKVKNFDAVSDISECDFEILSQMEQAGIDMAVLEAELTENRPSHIRNLYFLLANGDKHSADQKLQDELKKETKVKSSSFFSTDFVYTYLNRIGFKTTMDTLRSVLPVSADKEVTA
eukprot:Clim_evm69s153 gene=Clim_evmTU69s153